MSEIDYEVLKAERDRETLAAFGNAELSAKWDALQAAVWQFRAAVKVRAIAAQAYADVLAGIKGLKVGSRIVVVRKTGYGSNRREKTSRYEVVRWALGFGVGDLKVWAKTVKKDGTLGEIHYIWDDWEIEK